MAPMIVGMDPHRRSATIEIIDERETVLHAGRFGTDQDCYHRMLAAGRQHPQRVWAVEGCQGIGRHLVQRLVDDSETVVDVPAKLSARVRVFATGQAVRPTRSTRTRWPWSPYAPRVYGRFRLMMRPWRCACWSIIVTNWAISGPRSSTGCTACCWNCFPVGRRKFLSARALLASVRPEPTAPQSLSNRDRRRRQLPCRFHSEPSDAPRAPRVVQTCGSSIPSYAAFSTHDVRCER